MIGDPTGALTRNFDNMREDEGLADRATFVVDPQGIIQAIEVTAEGIGRDASDLLRKIKAAQYVASHPGEVCPAKWKEGEATLLRLWTSLVNGSVIAINRVLRHPIFFPAP